MSSPYVVLGDRSLDQWKVTELKEELKRRKLTTKGLKEDLVKRLDEAVRIERASIEAEKAKENVDNGLDAASLTELPPEPAVTETIVSERTEDLMVKETNAIENKAGEPKNEFDDHRLSQDESRAVETDSVQETNVSIPEVGQQVGQIASVGTTVVVSEKAESSTALIGSHLHTVETNDKDGDSTAGVAYEEQKPPEEDVKPDHSDRNAHVTQINESSMPVSPTSGPTQDTKSQDEALDSTAHLENDDSKPDHSVQPLEYQVSEVDPNLGLQVISDSVSTESVNIIEKNELKVDVITDNVKLELDVKHEMVQPSLSNVVPDGGESHPMDVEEPLDKKEVEEPIEKRDIEEPIEKNVFEEPLDKKVSSGDDVVDNDSLKDVDMGELGPPEKLNLDVSMEEDILENKQLDSKSNSNEIRDDLENSEMPGLKGDNSGAVVDDKPVVVKASNAENETASAATSVKRKFHDKEATGNHDSLKRPRRWNAESVKVPGPPSGGDVPSPISKDTSQPTLKRFSRSDSGANEEAAPKERVVPPSSKPPSNSLRIDRFLRPFTLKAVQELLGKTGTVTSFWMDHIKTHCYVSYSTVEEAVETRNAVYNLQWPPNGGRLLVAEFVDSQEVKTRVEAPASLPTTPSGSAAPSLSSAQGQTAAQTQPSPRQQALRQQVPPPSLPPPQLTNPPPVRERQHPAREPLPREQPIPARDRLNLPPPPPLPEKVDPPIVTLDDLFRKTKATPRIYYLPLSDEQVAAKLKQGKNVVQ